MNNRSVKTPLMPIEDLLRHLEEDFKIGYWDAEKEIVLAPNSPILAQRYRTLSPRDFETIRTGLNYDYVEFLSWYFTKHYKRTYTELFYIESDDGSNHCFLYYEDAHGHHVVEPAGFLPIEGVVDKPTRRACIEFVKNVFMSDKRGAKYVVIQYLPTGIYGVPLRQCMDEKWNIRLLADSNLTAKELSNNFNRFKFVL